MAWNVVTSYKREEALNFAYRALLDHDQCYDRADKYMALCSQLWASWEPDAVVMDPHTRPIIITIYHICLYRGIVAHPSMVRDLHPLAGSSLGGVLDHDDLHPFGAARQ